MKTKTILIIVGIVFVIIAIALLISWLVYRRVVKQSGGAGDAASYMSDNDTQLLRFLYGTVNFKFILPVNAKNAAFISKNSFAKFMERLLSYNLDTIYLGGIQWPIMKKILDNMPNSLKNA